ncbi:tRNA pseudouridine synthase A [Sinisalibacter aestuarii]|uniref:tRNA pseudouridine synthase A n=2 Tax=Sinisalibacter aestuarii TaxID=2949426 RepID=A0ABQ5LQL1_9RHOB|nr:tRNA pseudouridine synthase A [Sinisalibacter aestuarii]
MKGIAGGRGAGYPALMPRYALKIEYDGGPFAGWQRQADQPSVQGAVEAALAKLEADMPSIAAAGRTDAGVHAFGQVAHCDMAKDWDPFRLMEAVNYHLKPAPVAVVACAAVDEEFHARFSAVERRYLFRLVSRRAPLVHDRGRAWRVGHPLDADAMQAGAERLVGRHDFTTFRSVQCQADSPVKTLDELRVEELPYPGGVEFRFHVRARSFLHNQVRSFVGTLERVGAGAWNPDDVTAALAARDRAACGPVCPPEGLYLAGVGYPEDPFGDIGP